MAERLEVSLEVPSGMSKVARVRLEVLVVEIGKVESGAGPRAVESREGWLAGVVRVQPKVVELKAAVQVDVLKDAQVVQPDTEP